MALLDAWPASSLRFVPRMAQRKEYRNDPLTYSIIGCAIAVHKKLGPGLVESVYDDCFKAELESGGFVIRRQPRVNVGYDGIVLDRTFRPDYVINGEVVVEIKSVAQLLPVHQAQLLTYMKLAEIERGLIINFNVAVLAPGVKRVILSLPTRSDFAWSRSHVSRRYAVTKTLRVSAPLA